MDDLRAIEALSALAHSTRLRAFKMLVKAGPEGIPAGEIARMLAVPVTTMSTHLGILQRSGVIAARRESRTIFYALNSVETRNLFAFIMADCCNGRPDLCAPFLRVTADECV